MLTFCVNYGPTNVGVLVLVNSFSLLDLDGVSWPSGLAYRTQVLQNVGSNPGAAVTLVSLSKTLNHNCFSPPRG